MSMYDRELIKEAGNGERELKDLRSRISQCKNMQEMQMMQIPFVNGDSGMYMIGLYNGMEMMLAIMEGRRPEFAGMPMDVPSEVPETDGMGEDGTDAQRTISGILEGQQNAYKR